MLIFVTLRNCVKWWMDTCFCMQNRQISAGKYSKVYNCCPGGRIRQNTAALRGEMTEIALPFWGVLAISTVF